MAASPKEVPKPSNFLRTIIERDLQAGTLAPRITLPVAPTRPASARAFRLSRTATCTWVTPRASA
jgi:hypothetical protein